MGAKETASNIGGCLVALVFLAFVGVLLVAGPGRWVYYLFASKKLGESCGSAHECATDATCVEHVCSKKCEGVGDCPQGQRCMDTTGFSKVCH